jgi:ParB-like chromosome segregation protein Spo0J
VLSVDARPGFPPFPGLERAELGLVLLADLEVGYTPRQARLDEAHVTALAEMLEQLPPVIVDKRTMAVIDGAHRIEAFRRAKRTHIRALLFTGDETEAIALSIGNNVRHGKPLTSNERQEAARTLLKRCPDRSDRWIGVICGLSHSTVAQVRHTSESAEAGIAEAGVRVGRDGRRRPIDPMPGQAAVARVMTEEPDVSIRQAAGVAGVARSTAQRVASQRNREGAPAHPEPALTADQAFSSSPERVEIAFWLAKTSVSPDDLHTYLEVVPLGRIYEVVDECRRRARTWAEMADGLERQARGRSQAE